MGFTGSSDGAVLTSFSRTLHPRIGIANMLKKLRIVTLSENTVSANGFHAEWGLSLYAETEEGNFLLDTGNGASAV